MFLCVSFASCVSVCVLGVGLMCFFVCFCVIFALCVFATDMAEFSNLDRDIEGSAKRWKKFVEKN